jgi:hypothetical protein
MAPALAAGASVELSRPPEAPALGGRLVGPERGTHIESLCVPRALPTVAGELSNEQPDASTSQTRREPQVMC